MNRPVDSFATRLLFVGPGLNLGLVDAARHHIAAEQRVKLEVRSILPTQLDPDDLSPLEGAAREADVVLFDLRDATDVVAVLRRIREEHPDKVFIPLMGGTMDVMGLCRMGSFSMDRAPAGRGASVNYRRIEQITSFVEKLGSMLPVGPLRHARNWIWALRYWTAGGSGNVENLLRMVVQQYGGGRGPKAKPPVEPPTLRIAWPDDGRSFTSLDAFLAAHPPDRALPTVGVIYYGGLHRDASEVAVRAFARQWDGRANVVPIATDGVRSLEAVEEFLLRPLRQSGKRPVDALLRLQWFRLNGGPLGGDQDDTVAALCELGVPLFSPVTFYSQCRQAWEDSVSGVSPVEAYATIVLPELDGAIAPTPVLALDVSTTSDDALQATRGVAIQDGVEQLSDMVMRWMALRTKPRAQRRVALMVYDYPPGQGNLGFASYLDVSASVRAILEYLGREGYDVGDALDDSPLRALADAGLDNDLAIPEAALYLPAEAYQQYYATLPEAARASIEATFGPAPGQIMVEPSRGLRVPGKWYGNVLLAVQPAPRPGHEDTAAHHDQSLPPHHQYLAVYRYLAEQGIDCVVHVGTHGTVEFSPGKELAPSASCLVSQLHHGLPQLYLYTLANASESSLARRRYQAALLSHHTPSFVPAELYGEYRALLDEVERLREPMLSTEERARMQGELLASARELELPDDDVDTLEEELRELSVAAIPEGLHVYGQTKRGGALLAYLVQLGRRRLAGVHLLEHAEALAGRDGAAARLEGWLRQLLETGELPAELSERLGEVSGSFAAEVQSLCGAFLADRELPGLVHALDGRFVEPGLMGDPMRSPAVYPTGRNGAAFDPTRIPFPDALDRGARLADALIERHTTTHGGPPRTVALVLWGFETARSGGDTIGQLLGLVGGRLKDTPGWLPAFEPVPLPDLGRPRVDVHLVICGFFRDMFPTLVRDLDRLLREIAERDEPEADNPLRENSRILAESCGVEHRHARIFGPRPGEYGTDLPSVVGGGTWQEAAELGERFTAQLSHVYGARTHGVPAPDVLRGRLQRTEAVCQVIDGVEYRLGDLDHYFEFLGGLSRAVHNARGESVEAFVGDTARHNPSLIDTDTELRRATTTRLLNPKWIDAMLDHDLHGAQQIENRLTNLVGLAATVGASSLLFDEAFETFVHDEQMFSRLRDNNAEAASNVVRRLGEAHQRGFWPATDEQLATLKRRFAAVDQEEV